MRPTTTSDDDPRYTPDICLIVWPVDFKPPRALTSPIEILPTELLVEIFSLCADDPLGALALASVSRYWRSVSYSPRVWQLISLDDKKPIAYSHEQAKLWTSRSAPLTFDIELNISTSPDSILPLLSPVLDQISRCRELRITGMRKEHLFFPHAPLTMDCLAVTIHDPDENDSQTVSSDLISPVSPSKQLAMNVWLTSLPTPVQLVPLNFACLTLSEISFTIYTQPHDILAFLSACPALESFCLNGWMHDNESVTTPLPVVHLRELRRLDLCTTYSTRCILESLDAPSLTHLYLSHLNSNLHFETGLPMVEEDEEDEMIDFSLSQWSDQATGLGLRAFFSRYTTTPPPLEVLEMDYSDMRTSDFKFVFNRLENLERFLIVASDMSDTVLGLLRPFADEAGEVRVRLPRLSSLELYDCARFNGKIVVDMLTERVQFTDSTAHTLSQVVVEGCDGVSERHGQALSNAIGRRFTYG